MKRCEFVISTCTGLAGLSLTANGAVQQKTSQPDLFALAEKKGFLKKGKLAEGVKAGDIVQWLKDDFELGHGHAMALFALFKGIKKEGDK